MEQPKRFFGFLWECAGLYGRERISHSAAAFAYFMTFTIFPLLICVNAFVARTGLRADELTALLHPFVPAETAALLSDYLGYIALNQSPVLVAAALLAMLSGAAGAFGCVSRAIGDIYGQRRYTGVAGFLSGFVYSLAFLLVIYLGIAVVVTGDWFISLLDRWFGIGSVISNWNWLRFLLLFALIFWVLVGVYRTSAPKPRTAYDRVVLPGALSAAVALSLVSMLFSWFIGLSTRYALIYGSLASLIIMMFWLYVMGSIILLGGVVNRVLLLRRQRE